MQQQIDISDNSLLAALRERFGLAAASVEPLGLGEDTSAAVFRAEGQGGPWFVKLKRGSVASPGARLARFLADRGFDGAIAPLRARDGGVGVALEGWEVLVYPFVDAPTAAEAGLSGDQWVEYGRRLRMVHESTPALDREPALRDSLPRERFESDIGARAGAVRARLQRVEPDDQPAAAAAALWNRRAADIDALLLAVDVLSRMLRDRGRPLVLCHADIHRYNVLVDDDRLLFADWDEAMLSLRERDLMFILEGVIGPEPVTPEEEARFWQGYGEVEVDEEALTYYRCLWAAQDVVEFSERVWLPDLDEAARHYAVRMAAGVFAPGDEADVALASLRRPGPDLFA